MQCNNSVDEKNERAAQNSNELTCSATEVSPYKLRSPPPPKPPRRRHSDQLSISPSGTFPSSRKKSIDGSKSPSNDNMPKKKSNNKSGCGSLPANWTAGFQSVDDAIAQRCQNLNVSIKSGQVMSNKTSSSNKIIEKCATSLKDNLTSNEKSTNSNHLQNNQCKIVQLQKLGSKTYQQKHFVNCSIQSVDKYGLQIIRPNILILSKELHRRRHSDPIVFHNNPVPNNLCLVSQMPLNVNTNIKFCDFKNSTVTTSTKACDLINGATSACDSITDAVSKNTKVCDSKTGIVSKDIEVCYSKDDTLLRENKYLHEEIQSLKEINNKVWKQLISVQAALENFEKLASDDYSPVSVSELLSQLYKAQKIRDRAMEERLTLSIEEKDRAVAELEEIIHAVSGGFDENDSICTYDSISENGKDIKDILREIERTENPAELLQQQRLLLSHLYRSKEAKQDRLAHELKLVSIERDTALEKVRKLEEELKYTKFCNDVAHFDKKHWETSLLDILCQVMEQRDTNSNLKKNDSLHEKKQYKKGHRSPKLQKSFNEHQGNEPGTKSDLKQSACSSYSNSFLISSTKSSSFDKSKSCQSSNDILQDEIEILKDETFVLRKALEDEIKRREQAEAKCQRLERVVNVLQKKINGQNVGVPI